jgi:hypothetical protein
MEQLLSSLHPLCTLHYKVIVYFIQFVDKNVINCEFHLDNRQEIVVGTDYTNYAILYSCTNPLSFVNMRELDRGMQRTFRIIRFYFYFVENLWLLTRQKIPTTTIVNNMNQILQDRGISRAILTKTRQNC